MPCYEAEPTPEERANWNAQKYGVNCTYHQMMRDIACNSMKILEANGLLDTMPSYALHWYELHKQGEAGEVYKHAGEK